MNIEDLGRGRKAIWVRGYTDGIGNIDFFNRYRDTEELNCLLKDQIYLMEENDFRLDVPELNQPKPVVPQFVADWYENNKDRLEEAICSLVWLIGRFGSVTDIEHWFTKTENAIQTLINMHQFGYTVEKEKLYTVEIPNPNEGQLSFVLMRQPGGNVRIKVMHSSNLDLLKTDNDLQLTEAEIKKDFDWAWQWKKEVTEL